jgi:propanol-preferring alcohol dehydrogenase
MKAMLLHEPKPAEDGPLSLEDVPVPEPGPEEVLIRVSVCGVCHTDLHTVEGDLDLKKRPIIPGHQIVGTVEKTGPNTSKCRKGDRVGVTWLYSSCRECDYCRQGLENLCDGARFTGLHTDGGYAEFAVVPELYVFPLPHGFPDEQAAPLLCAGVIGYRSLRLSGIAEGGRLGLYGFGASAHIALQVALYRGCEAYVFTRSRDHRRHALELGAAWAGDARDPSPCKMHSSIIFAPAGWIVREALRNLDKGGTLAINAVHMSPIPELPYDLIYHERTVRSVANLTRGDTEEFLPLAAEVPVKTDVTMYTLEEANTALQHLKRSEIRGAAVLTVRA